MKLHPCYGLGWLLNSGLAHYRFLRTAFGPVRSAWLTLRAAWSDGNPSF